MDAYGSKRVGCEVLLPQPGGELHDLGGRVLADALEHIDQINIGVDVVQAAGGDQALRDAYVFGPELGPAEEPVVPLMLNST